MTALSNWDTLALNEKGEPIAGGVITPAGVRAQFYKNWLYIYDDKGWHEGFGYTRPCVMEIHEGRMQYKDANILAFRGPQNGIYAVVWSGWEHFDRDKDKRYGHPLRGMTGCSVYGYSEETEERDAEFVGVLPESIEWFRAKLLETNTEPMIFWGHTIYPGEKTTRLKQVVYSTPNNPWYIHDVPEAFRKLDWAQAVRFNQGDAYFAGKLDFPTPITKPGEADDTLLSRTLKPPKE